MVTMYHVFTVYSIANGMDVHFECCYMGDIGCYHPLVWFANGEKSTLFQNMLFAFVLVHNSLGTKLDIV